MKSQNKYTDPYPGYKATEITSLSELSRKEFLDLMSSDHPSAKNYREYGEKEFKYRILSYKELNKFFKPSQNKTVSKKP